MADPTVTDVYNQLVLVNGKLDQLNVSITAQATAFSHLDSDVKKGFKSTVDTLNAIAQIETGVATLLFHLTQQGDTIICALEHISKNTCDLVTQSTIQTGLQTRIRQDADASRAILEAAHPEAALLDHRLAELREQVERCCPPEKPPPACTYAPCPAPNPIDMPPLPDIPKGTAQSTKGQQPK